MTRLAGRCDCGISLSIPHDCREIPIPRRRKKRVTKREWDKLTDAERYLVLEAEKEMRK